MNTTTENPRTHAGGCHCGAVRFEADIDLSKGASGCNCTVCVKRGAAGVIVKPHALRLLSGKEALGEYAWGTRSGTFYFCSRCGINVFGHGDIPQIGGAYASINVHCLDGIDPATLKLVYWDGRHDNWQAGPRDAPWPVA
jgi:hypothetical protein